MELRRPDLIAQVLQDHLYSGNRVLRERAAEFISGSRSRFVKRELAKALRAPQEFIATRAAWGLTLCADVEAISLLKRALQGKNPRALKQAAWALGRIDDARARRVLVEALGSRRRLTRIQAAAGLWRAAVGGYRSARVERMLIGLLPGDRGHAALTLSHMLRNRTSSRRARPSASELTVFERHGGSWIR